MSRFLFLCILVLIITLTVAWIINRVTHKEIPRMPIAKNDDAEDIGSLQLLRGYLTNDGLDTFFSMVGAREWEIDRFRRALARVGALTVWPIIQRAEQFHLIYHDESDRSEVPSESPEGQVTVKAYLAQMHAWDAEIDALGFDFGALADQLKAAK